MTYIPPMKRTRGEQRAIDLSWQLIAIRDAMRDKLRQLAPTELERLRHEFEQAWQAVQDYELEYDSQYEDGEDNHESR
jgi:hypothetical protein